MDSFVRSTILCLVLISTCLFSQVECGKGKFGIPFVSKLSKKDYTPLVFFTYPKGNIDECDEMEKVVSQVERELNVRVERLDVAKDANAAATMQLLTNQQGPPFLYNRESCQVVHSANYQASMKKKGPSDAATSTAEIDKARVRAWAKGRYLPPPGVKLGGTSNSKIATSAPVVDSQEDNALDQAELIKESSLTPEQLEGKKAMEERTAAASKN